MREKGVAGAGERERGGEMGRMGWPGMTMRCNLNAGQGIVVCCAVREKKKENTKFPGYAHSVAKVMLKLMWCRITQRCMIGGNLLLQVVSPPTVHFPQRASPLKRGGPGGGGCPVVGLARRSGRR